MIDLRRLAIILLGSAIALLVIAIATSNWSCGNLFDSCQRSRDKSTIVAILVLLLIGLVLLTVVFILDLIGLCSSTFITSGGYVTARFILLYIGVACILTALLVYTGKIYGFWSYFLACVGGVFAVQVGILAIMSSRCVTARSDRVVIRTAG